MRGEKMPAGSTIEECRSLIRDAHSVLKSEIPPSAIDALDPMESALAFEEQKKQWLFAAAQKLSAMTNYQVSLLSVEEQRVRNNLISGSEGLLAIRNKAEIDRTTALAQLRTDRENRGSSGTNDVPGEKLQPTRSKIIAWGFGVCLLTGLARPIRPGSNTPALFGWIAPETRSILLEDPIYRLAELLGFGLGAILPAIIVYGIYWGIRHLIKPRKKINWSALLGLSVAFGAMSVMGSYRHSGEKHDNSTSPYSEAPSNLAAGVIRQEELGRFTSPCLYTFVSEDTGTQPNYQIRLVGDLAQNVAFFRINGQDRICQVSDFGPLHEGTSFYCGPTTRVTVVVNGSGDFGHDYEAYPASTVIEDAGAKTSIGGFWGSSC